MIEPGDELAEVVEPLPPDPELFALRIEALHAFHEHLGGGMRRRHGDQKTATAAYRADPRTRAFLEALEAKGYMPARLGYLADTDGFRGGAGEGSNWGGK